MAFLLDTDICSAHIRRPEGLVHRFVQYAGRLHISIITLAELKAGAVHSGNAKIIQGIQELLLDVEVMTFDLTCVEQFCQVRGRQLQTGRLTPVIDLLIAATALAHDLTLVTHNTAHFAAIPGLRLDDWLLQ